MEVEITLHAARRMEQRGLDRAWIEDIVRRPDWTDPGDPSLTRAFGRVAAMDGRVLRVVFSRPSAYAVRVVTAFFDRDASADRQNV